MDTWDMLAIFYEYVTAAPLWVLISSAIISVAAAAVVIAHG